MNRNSKRDRIIKRLSEMAFARPNDAVRLLTDDCDELKNELGGLDLMSVSEIKRGSNGVIEIKFIDRLKAIETLLSLTETEESGSGGSDTDRLITAIERASYRDWQSDPLDD